MATKSVSSRYNEEELYVLDQARGKTPRASFQKNATMDKVEDRNAPSVVETWADHMGVNPGPLPSDAALAKIADLGLKWCSVSPEAGWMTPQQVQAAVQRVKDYGLKVQAVVQFAGHDYSNVNQSAFANHCLSLADAGADAMTIGNEWNNPAFWKNPDPLMQQAAILSGSAILQLRLKYPTLPVFSCGWSPAGGTLAPANVMREFCRQLIQRTIPPMLFTGASHHPYVYNGVQWGMPQHPEWNSFVQTPQVYAAARSSGMPGPMSFTEYGVPSAGTQTEYPNETFNEQSQAEKLQAYLEGFMKFRMMGLPIYNMLLSTAIDGDATTRPIESTMGVFRSNLQPKPAADVIRKFAKKEWW